MLDAGTKPRPRSILDMWTASHSDQYLGGVCGNVSPWLGRSWRDLLNPLVAAQNFEYKVSCILDRPLETRFGYLSVLPGAFSGHRYEAMMGEPQQQYFRGDPTLPKQLHIGGDLISTSSFVQNLLLAEDRILSFELSSKPGCKWHISYVKSAKADTDIPKNTTEFITQRRRWFNGFFAVTIYLILIYHRVYRSQHSITRWAVFHAQILTILSRCSSRGSDLQHSS